MPPRDATPPLKDSSPARDAAAAPREVKPELPLTGFATSGFGMVLDQLELPFVVFDAQFNPVILSTSGARLLDFGPNDSLRQHTKLIEPLQEFAKRWLPAERSAAAKPAAERLAAQSTGGQSTWGPGGQGQFRHRLEELEMVTASGRSFQALAFLRGSPVVSADAIAAGDLGEQMPGVVLFQDLTYFQPFFNTIEQSRRNRSLIVLMSSLLGARVDLGSGAGAFSKYLEAEELLNNAAPLAATAMAGCDVLKELSLAVDIVDPMIVPSSKIIVLARSSALLNIARPVCLRLLAHLLLEATDFGGPFGRTTVDGTMLTAVQKPPLGEYTLRISADRKDELPIEASPLEVYLYRRYVPSQYRVSMSDDVEDADGSETARRATRTISRASFSENLLIAAEIAGRFGASLVAKRPTPTQLELTLTFSLMAGRLTDGKPGNRLPISR